MLSSSHEPVSKPAIHEAELGVVSMEVAGPADGLQSLDLGGNGLTQLTLSGDLAGLTNLYLGGNALHDLSFLKGRDGITTLDLSNNALTSVVSARRTRS